MQDSEDFEFDWRWLSADSDCNEQRAAAAGQRIIRMFVFLLLEDSEERHF